LLGASIGLVIALLLVAVREAVDTTVRSEADVEEILGAPVLASVRSLPRRARIVTYGRHETAFGDTYALLAATLAQTSEGAPRVYAVTSALPSEGKTTTVANLGVALARRGHRVIIADFDFRKPRIAELFGIPENSLGTLNVLDGTASPSRVVWQVTLEGSKPEASPVETTRNGNSASDGARGGSLWVLPAGGALRNQSDLRLERLSALLTEMRKRADFVLIDTPPALLTVEMAELGSLIDAVLIVVRHGRVTHRSLRSLQRQAGRWSAEIAGAVLTDSAAEGRYGYYGGR
jgi:Mrp family chromosome partitioning ATPase